MTKKLDWRRVMAWRVERHRLGERVPKARALDVVGEIGGLHAQLMSSAELALWARVNKLKRNDVEKCLWTDRRLFNTWAMRGTLSPRSLSTKVWPTNCAGAGAPC